MQLNICIEVLIVALFQNDLWNNSYFCKISKWFVILTSKDMDLNATIDLIIKDLEDAREIIDDLKKYSGVPIIQVELAKSKCRSAGEVIALLKNQGDNIQEAKEDIIRPPQQKQPKLLEEKKTIFSSASFIPPPEKEKISTPRVESTSRAVEKKEESKKIQVKTSESSILADKFSHLSNRFNEQLGNLKNEEDVADILKTKPLTNLSEAIGVNDKFLFVREIFNDNNDAYTQAISQLDNAESLPDARAVLRSYTGSTNENEAVKQLLELVKRKLQINE
jgi:hypothetical protein